MKARTLQTIGLVARGSARRNRRELPRHWAADGPISEPVVVAVMIGTQGTTSYSFVSQGRAVRMVGADRS